MVDSADIAQARRDLGRQLAAFRRAAGHTQHTFAPLVQYGRSTVANVETGRQSASRDFWVRSDEVLACGGRLARSHAKFEALRKRHLRNEAVGAPTSGQAGGNGTGRAHGTGRRDVFDLAGGLLAAAVDARASRMADLVAALTAYEWPVPQRDADVGVASLAAAAAQVKRLYQSGRHADAVRTLPDVLRQARAARSAAPEARSSQVDALVADIYHVVGSVLLKFGDASLAMVAADRSMTAAQRSDEPIAIAGSARLATHALMSSGHPDRAADMAQSVVERFDRLVPKPPEDGLAVRGALLLRGAIASARHEERERSLQLLDEASAVGERVGRDGNLRWTAFGPTNVLLHRLNVAVTLGDAGHAIAYAKQVRLDRVALAERRACLFIDVARAFTQWGKHDKAYQALRTAEKISPQELQVRRTVHRLISDLICAVPNRLQAPLREMAERIGAAV